MEKYLEAEDPFSSGFFCLDCCIRGMHDDCQFTKKEGLDIGLVLYLQV